MASEQGLVAAEVADMTEVLITLLFAGTVKYSNVFDISDNKAQWFIRCHFPKKSEVDGLIVEVLFMSFFAV